MKTKEFVVKFTIGDNDDILEENVKECLEDNIDAYLEGAAERTDIDVDEI